MEESAAAGAPAARACRQGDCPVASGGACLEGFGTLSECPHFLLPVTPDVGNEEGATATAGADATPAGIPMVPLPSGEALTADEAAEVTRAAPTKVIVVAGAAESGKTTLIASLYELFQWGAVGDYLFAGSRTLVGFERRCHLSRLASERGTSDTERTQRHEILRFLHLRVRRRDLREAARDLLLADIPGERFRLAQDSTADARALSVLPRADHLLVLVDGERLATPGKRQGAAREPQTLLRSCLDAGMVSAQTRIDVVFTKWDLLQPANGDDGAGAFVRTVEQAFRDRFAHRVSSLRFFNVAARPQPPSALETGFGLRELFLSWLVEEPRTAAVDTPLRRPSSTREFDQYFSKRLPARFV